MLLHTRLKAGGQRRWSVKGGRQASPFAMGSRDGTVVRRSARQELARPTPFRQNNCLGASASGVQGGTSRRSGWPCDRGHAAIEAAKRKIFDQRGQVLPAWINYGLLF